ncbi:hypothetical protein [Pedococcus sp. 5OH_020]|uniref:hypothetical protein n=1 Tax=Pedococcus sp. 5OH_020 TaxID=2989814 RepID=UPI0022E9D35F|nr:hypothetical protein [Pedococcus sp. 5OH_020]
MSSSLATVFAASQEQTRELPMPSVVFGLLAFIGFLSLLGVLWAFRGTASKVAAGRVQGHHGDQGHHTEHMGSHR